MMLSVFIKRQEIVYVVVLFWALGLLVACGSLLPEEVPPKTAPLIKITPAADWAQVYNDQTIAYWHAGDLWRAAADGSHRQQVTHEELFGEWYVGPERDPWWIGGPPPRPAISPDGRWLVAAVDGRNFAVIDLATAEPPRLFPATAQTFSWSPDSRYIAYGRDKLNVFDVAAGQLLDGPERRPGDVADIVWSPDGLEIAFACCFRPNEQQAGEEIGDVYRYNVASATAGKAGETWRGLASGTPGLCWVDGQPVPADEPYDRSHCSPKQSLPIADSEDGLWRAELAGYLPEENVFTEILVTETTGDPGGLRLDLTDYAPLPDLRNIFWLEAGKMLLLGSSWPGSPIYRWDLSQEDGLTPVIEDGLLLGVVPQWAASRSN